MAYTIWPASSLYKHGVEHSSHHIDWKYNRNNKDALSPGQSGVTCRVAVPTRFVAPFLSYRDVHGDRALLQAQKRTFYWDSTCIPGTSHLRSDSWGHCMISPQFLSLSIAFLSMMLDPMLGSHAWPFALTDAKQTDQMRDS
jgi:hypothetical protein